MRGFFFFTVKFLKKYSYLRGDLGLVRDCGSVVFFELLYSVPPLLFLVLVVEELGILVPTLEQDIYGSQPPYFFLLLESALDFPLKLYFLE